MRKKKRTTLTVNCNCGKELAKFKLRSRRPRQRSNIDEVLGLPLLSTASKRTREREAEDSLLDQGYVTGNMLALPSTERPRKRKRRTGNKSRSRRYAEGNHEVLFANVPNSDDDVPLLELPSTARRRS